MATYRNQYHQKIFYKTNQYITAPTMRLVDEDSRQIGVMSREEALAQSRQTGLDLVEIAPKANPPVVKLIDFSKFKYQESKKLKAERRGIQGGELKELQMTPFIGPGDFDTRLKKAERWFASGNKVKLSVKFQGRQITHKEFGYQLIDKFKAGVGEYAAPEGEPKLIGKILLITFSPVKKTKKPSHENSNQEIQNPQVGQQSI